MQQLNSLSNELPFSISSTSILFRNSFMHWKNFYTCIMIMKKNVFFIYAEQSFWIMYHINFKECRSEFQWENLPSIIQQQTKQTATSRQNWGYVSSRLQKEFYQCKWWRGILKSVPLYILEFLVLTPPVPFWNKEDIEVEILDTITGCRFPSVCWGVQSWANNSGPLSYSASSVYFIL
jgi:hypothetical protein